jgi:hypothetical protein
MELENTYVSGPNPEFSYFNMLKYYANSSVSIATGYRLDGSGSISGRGKGLPLLHSVLTATGSHPGSYPKGTGGTFPGVKGASVWNWSLTSIQCPGQ